MYRDIGSFGGSFNQVEHSVAISCTGVTQARRICFTWYNGYQVRSRVRIFEFSTRLQTASGTSGGGSQQAGCLQALSSGSQSITINDWPGDLVTISDFDINVLWSVYWLWWMSFANRVLVVKTKITENDALLMGLPECRVVLVVHPVKIRVW